MALCLRVLEGALAGQTLEVEPGEPFLIGRSPEARLSVPTDPFMSGKHAQLVEDSGAWRIEDLGSSNGTLWNNVRVPQAVLKDGDQVRTGATVLYVESGATQSRKPTREERLIRFLRERPEPILAIVDTAQDPQVYGLIRDTLEPNLSLFEGPNAESLREVAPYLVALTGNDPLLQSLVYAGWGKHWALYLCSPVPFMDLRKHLRTMLMADTESGKRVYFRFYDGRVLRTYLPTCRPEELARVFGPVRCFMTEGDDPDTLLEFTREPDGALNRREVSFAAPAQGSGAKANPESQEVSA